MKKIDLIVLDYSKSGGIERFCFVLQKILKQTGRHVRIISLFNSKELQVKGNSIKVIRNRAMKPMKFLDLIMTMLILKKATKGTSLVIHCFNNVFILHALLAPLSLKNFIYTEHSDYDAVRRLVRLALKFLLPFVALTVCQTEKSLTKYHGSGLKKLVKLPPSYVEDRPDICVSRSSDDVMRVAFVGRLVQQKGVLDFLQIGSNLHKLGCKIELHIFGMGELWDTVEQQIRQNGMCEYTYLHGYHEHWYDISTRLDFIFLLAQSESFSIVGIEALANGIGIVSYDDLAGPREYLNRYNSLTIARGAHTSFNAALYGKLNELKHSADFRMRCVESVNKYSRRSFKKQWDEVLSNV